MAKKVKEESQEVKAVKPVEEKVPEVLEVAAVLNSKRYCSLVPRFVLKARLYGKTHTSVDELDKIVTEYLERR